MEFITTALFISTIYLFVTRYIDRKNLKRAEALIDDYQDKLDEK